MKKVLSFIIGFLMICALMVGSGDPVPGTPLKTIITTELVCLAMLTIGALWLWKTYRNNR